MTNGPKVLVPATGELLVYIGADGAARVQVRLSKGTVWLTQRSMGELYGKDVRTINEHLGNITSTMRAGSTRKQPSGNSG